MKSYVVVSLCLALLAAGCSLSSMPPAARTAAVMTPSPVVPTLASPLTPSLLPLHGSALSFDGLDDYVMVEHDPSLDFQNSFTIAAWIFLESFTEWASLVTKGDKPNVNNYAIQQSGPDDPTYGTQSGRLRFSGCTTLSAPLPESQTSLSLRTWHFVAVTFDGLEMRFYSNGKQDGSFAVSGPLCTNERHLYIGVDFPLTTEHWHGGIDELRIWNAALSETQIHDAMKRSLAPEEALVGYWSFDEGSGFIAHDRSGHENHGHVIGNPSWMSPGAPVP